MNRLLKYLFLLVAVFGTSLALRAQPENPVSRKTSYTVQPDGTVELLFTADIPAPWHLYDLGPYDGGPNETAFTFEPNPDIALIGPVRQKSASVKQFDPVFEMEIGYFAGKADFTQQVKLLSPEKGAIIKGTIDWMVCDDTSCLPPTDEDFTIRIPAQPTVSSRGSSTDEIAITGKMAPLPTIPTDVALEDESDTTEIGPGFDIENITPNETVAKTALGKGNFWSTILEAILWGFAALLTPCVFPMVPMTVSFFMKGDENRKRGRFMALLYGASIVLLYTVPIALIIFITHAVGGEAVTADIFNWLATHWLPNVIFFLVFMIFAASFFGAFEITMPSRLVNKSDSKADKGGLIGLFFMALTLVLVSFSCTGPIVGSVLIKSTSGDIWDPVLTMFAFSVAFALPFTFFAFFPTLLKSLPKSGGWLNSVKVVLGFLELALGLKFLSVADQTYHWGILDREVYLALWIVIFSLLGFYLLGKLRFKYDSEVRTISVGRLVLSILVFSFVVYLIPGMWGAPLKGISGYLPPLTTQDFVLGQNTSSGNSAPAQQSGRKYADLLSLPHGLDGFFDYQEAVEYAKKVNKPIFLDYTGHGCVNCREMEARVWSDPKVLSLLQNEFVILALYSDDKKTLPETDWVTTKTGKTLKGLGKINAYFVHQNFGINSQPYYMILDHNGNELAPGRGYNLNINEFTHFLETGLKQFQAYDR